MKHTIRAPDQSGGNMGLSKALRVSWRDRSANTDILTPLGIEHELLVLMKKRKLIFLGNAVRGEGLTCDITRGHHPGKRS